MPRNNFQTLYARERETLAQRGREIRECLLLLEMEAQRLGLDISAHIIGVAAESLVEFEQRYPLQNTKPSRPTGTPPESGNGI